MPFSIFSFDVRIFEWAERRPDETAFAPSLRLLALIVALLISLGFWAGILALIAWLIA